jgi:hypothetical protein
VETSHLGSYQQILALPGAGAGADSVHAIWVDQAGGDQDVVHAELSGWL